MSESAAGSEPISSERRRPRQARAHRTVERILAAARRLLAEEGPDRFNTNRIAAEAGVGVGTLYGYFADKEAVASALAEEVSAAEAETVLAALDELEGAGLDETIRALVPLTFRLYGRNAPLFDALGAIFHRDRTRVGRRRGERRILAAVRDRIIAEMDELAVDEADLAAWMVFHTVESAAHRASREPEPTFPPEVLAAETATAVRRYLGLPGGADGGAGPLRNTG